MKRKSDSFSHVIVGFFMLSIMIMLGYFTIVISGVELLTGRTRKPISIVFSQVGGLKEHDNVMFRGTKVGSVDCVEVTPSNLVVIASIDERVVLRSGYRIAVCNLSMLGGNYLLLEEGAGAPIDYLNMQLQGETPTDWMRDVSKIAKNLNELTSRPELYGIITNLEATSEKARTIADNIDKVTARLERGEGTMGKLFANDDALYEDLKAGVAAFRKSAESFDAKDTVCKANKLLDNLNAVAEGIRNGKGTLGKLANDAEMYNEVNSLIKDVRQVVDNFRDTTPISTFSSLAVGAF